MKILIFLVVGIITFFLGGAIIQPEQSMEWGILLFSAIFAAAMSTLFLYFEDIIRHLERLTKNMD